MLLPLHSRSNEFPLRTLIVGPTVGSASKHRPGTAPSNGRKHPDPAAPRFLDKEGRWVQEQLPVTVLETQAQPLSATVTIDAKVNLEGNRLKTLVVSGNEVVHRNTTHQQGIASMFGSQLLCSSSQPQSYHQSLSSCTVSCRYLLLL